MSCNGDRSSCSWCDTINYLHDRFCRGCGHEAHFPRLSCRCGRATCLPSDAPETPLEAAVRAAVRSFDGYAGRGERSTEVPS